MSGPDGRYPPISDYALISECHTAALVSRAGSIDWCCFPRFDSGSHFGRLLDWEKGGFCAITPVGECRSSRRYLDGTLVLETTFETETGEARLTDCFAMREGGRDEPLHQILRVVVGVRGRMAFWVRVSPRFDSGSLRPWLRSHAERLFTAIGGNEGLVIDGDPPLDQIGRHDLQADFEVREGGRVRLSLQFARPETIDYEPPSPLDPRTLDRRLSQTIDWWRRWTEKLEYEGPDRAAVLRSATVLKALTNAPTGAIVAAVTTSLPEELGGERNWDYRYSWIRDSIFTVRSLGDLGAMAEADALRRFMERCAAGSVEDLQILYGVGGERRRWLQEWEVPWLEGYRGSAPVRVGNGAAGQVQHDTYGLLMDLVWRWYKRGNVPDDDYWAFLVDVVNAAGVKWKEPDRGIWEVRGELEHFVHSKVLCWEAVDHGIRMARDLGREAPLERWESVRSEIRSAIETHGVEHQRGIFVRAFGRRDVDAALLLLPRSGFVPYDDERMVRTVDAIVDQLVEADLVWRYRSADGIRGDEGAFLTCSYWLVEALARQGRREDARRFFDAACGTANDLGLLAEEYDPRAGMMLGNYPQGLSHLSHISAAIALNGA